MWIEKALPPRNVIQEDLESRGIDFVKWSELARKDQELPQKQIYIIRTSFQGRCNAQ